MFSVDSTSWRSNPTGLKSLSKPQYAAAIEGGSAANRDDLDSQHSRSQIIKETRTFAVESSPGIRDDSPQRSTDVY